MRGPLSAGWGKEAPGEYDQRFSRLEATSSLDVSLSAWALSSAFSLTSATRDSDGVITVASITWPDGSPGTLTRTSKNATFMAVDAYTITHTRSGKTVTQSAVTRDADGSVTAQPAITVSQ